MQNQITNLHFELFENIIHIEFDSTFTNNETLCNIAITMSLCWCDRRVRQFWFLLQLMIVLMGVYLIITVMLSLPMN